MGRYLIRVECPEERFLEWSTIVDAPVTGAMTESDLREYIRLWQGLDGLRDLDQRLKRCREKGTSALDGSTLAGVIACNRAGPNETNLTLEEIIERYCIDPEAAGEEKAS